MLSPTSAMPMPTYMGLRTKRYGPVMTSRRGGSKGAGVPRPRQANSQTHGRPMAAPIATKILPVSEDRIQGFARDPIGEIAARSGVDVETVVERIRAMLRAGTIRRVRQTLMATNLAEGALVAWQFPPEKVDAAFDFMFQQDPFSGHVVIRS